jgi:hypothetical protein
MTDSANVRSLDALRVFKAALDKFAEGAGNGLLALQMELDRAVDWIEHDRPKYWARQVQIGYHKVAEARTALATCRARRVAGRPLACLDEKIALRKAQQRLAHAEEMVKVVNRWRNKLRHESNEYRGRIGQLQRCLESDLPRMLAMLERMSSSLEAYVSVAAHHTPVDVGNCADEASTSAPARILGNSATATESPLSPWERGGGEGNEPASPTLSSAETVKDQTEEQS